MVFGMALTLSTKCWLGFRNSWQRPKKATQESKNASCTASMAPSSSLGRALILKAPTHSSTCLFVVVPMITATRMGLQVRPGQRQLRRRKPMLLRQAHVALRRPLAHGEGVARLEGGPRLVPAVRQWPPRVLLGVRRVPHVLARQDASAQQAVVTAHEAEAMARLVALLGPVGGLLLDRIRTATESRL